MKESNFEAQYSKANELFLKKNYEQALEILENALNNANDEQKSRGFQLYGSIYNETFNKEKALDFYQKGLKIAVNADQKISLLNKIALLYAGMKLFNKSIEFYEKCLKEIQETNDLNKELILLKNLGKLYMHNKQYVDALKCHQRALALKKLSGDIAGQADYLRYIGQDYETSGNYTIARDYYEQSQKLYEKIGSKDEISKINKLLDNLDEIEEELDEEKDIMSEWHIKYDERDFF
jgi:tetratricopeptide (TPR) repeat protein